MQSQMTRLARGLKWSGLMTPPYFWVGTLDPPPTDATDSAAFMIEGFRSEARATAPSPCALRPRIARRESCCCAAFMFNIVASPYHGRLARADGLVIYFVS